MQPENVIRMAETPPPPSGGADAPTGGKGDKKKQRRTPVDMGTYTRLMEHFALIYSTQTAWDDESRRIVPVPALRLAFTSDSVKSWLNSPHRRMVLPEQLQFEPGRTLDEPCINLWDGLAMKPKAGDCGPIIELLQYLCSESAQTPEERATVCAWVLRWLALPLQRPGTKMRSALVFHGPQGAGKNLMFEIVAAIYGKYALVVGQDQLEDKFNDWASMKLFLIGDEVVARQELWHNKNKLKAFITGETIQINAKMMPLRTEANHCNVVFLSNEHMPLALEPGDRRYMVIWTPPRDDSGLYQRVADCLANGGREAFLHYLLTLPMEGYSEYQIPPMTRAKKDLIELGLKPQERFVREWLAGFMPLPCQVCSTEQLYRAFKRWASASGERFPPSQVAFSKGVEKAAQGRLTCKPFKLPAEFNGQTYLRIWLLPDTGPPEGVQAGQWAKDAADAFETSLRSYVDADIRAAGGAA
jgi:putative DNA primase/helicase